MSEAANDTSGPLADVELKEPVDGRIRPVLRLHTLALAPALLPLIFSGLPGFVGVEAIHFLEKIEGVRSQVLFVNDSCVCLLYTSDAADE